MFTEQAFDTYHHVSITCDRCGIGEQLSRPTRDEASRALYLFGWRINSKARKHVHLCADCAAARKAK